MIESTQPSNKQNQTEVPEMNIIEFDYSLLEESVDLFMNVFSQPPWNDVFESKDMVTEFFHSFLKLPIFKGYQLISGDNKLIGLSIGFIKPWLKEGCLRYEYFIDQFCIDSTYQGKGIGKFFINQIEKDLKQNNIQDIIVNTELSSPAFHFYIQAGFHNMEEYGFLSKEL